MTTDLKDISSKQMLLPHTLTEWLAYIERLHPETIALGLKRIQSIAQPLQLTHFTCPVITVAGTNGKGSTVAALHSMWMQAGYRVASYTSPHIDCFNERLRIQHRLVSDDELCQAFECIEQARRKHAICLTFFEFTTLAILWVLQQQDLDVVILEVGLGGRLDAVNIVDADVAVITNIDFDHQAWLGNTRAAIAREKAGIMRPKRPVVCGDPQPPDTLVKNAQSLACDLLSIGQAFYTRTDQAGWQWFGPQQRHYSFTTLPKIHVNNAASALMVIELMQPQLPIYAEQIAQGLDHMQLTARLERVTDPIRKIDHLFDVAHNPQAIAHLADYLRQMPIKGKTYAVFSLLRDKLSANIVQPIVSVIDAWYIAPIQAARAAGIHEIQQLLTTYTDANIVVSNDLAQAYRAVLEVAQSSDRIIVFGSFYVVSAVRSVIKENDVIIQRR